MSALSRDAATSGGRSVSRSFREDFDGNEVGVEGELGGQGGFSEWFLENEFGHDEAGFGDELRVFVADDRVPDERGVTVHAEGGQEAAGQALGFGDAGGAVGAEEEGNGGVATGLQFLGQVEVFLNDGHSQGVGDAAVLVEFEGFPFAGVRGQAVLGFCREVDMPAGAIGDVLEKLVEDQFLEVVFGAEDDLSRLVNGLAVGEGRACVCGADGVAARAERLVVKGLRQMRWSEADLKTRRKGDLRKVKLAQRLRSQTTMPLSWIAERLNMGSRGYLAWLLGRGEVTRKSRHPNQSRTGC
jgi:hypothetical protein